MTGIEMFVLLLSSLAYGDSANTDFEGKEKLAAELTTLLSNQGWQSIDHVAVKHILLDPNESFTVNDVFVPDVTPIVNVDNFDRKYVITVHLLGCVYSNAVFEVENLIKYILQMCSREKKNHRMQSYYEQTSTHSQRANNMVHDELLHPYEIFQIALQQIEFCKPMFEHMISALDSLVDMPPKSSEISQSLLPIRELIETIVRLRDMNFHKNTSYNPYSVSEINPEDVCKYSGALLRFINARLTLDLAPFENKYCSLPQRNNLNITDYIKWYKSRYPESQKYKQRHKIITHLVSEIEKLVPDVTKSYYTELGFAYNDVTKKTSISDPLYVNSSSTDNIRSESDETNNSG